MAVVAGDGDQLGYLQPRLLDGLAARHLSIGRINPTSQHHKRKIRANDRSLTPSHSDNSLANTLKSNTSSLNLPLFHPVYGE